MPCYSVLQFNLLYTSFVSVSTTISHVYHGLLSHVSHIGQHGAQNSAYDRCANHGTVLGMLLRLSYSSYLDKSLYIRYYGAIIPGVLNLVTMAGFMILNCILGGQTLASVSDGQLSWT